MKRQSGFTLIELVMVIVILGILSAFALPRFADLGQEARLASLNGLVGALNSATAIARADQLVNGAALNASVNLDGQTVTMIGGAPTADAAGIVVAAGVNVADYPISGGAATAGNVLTFTIQTNCTATYTAATTATAGGVTTIDVPAAAALGTTTGC